MTEKDEQVLQGGVNTVVRVGTTVRRPVGPWTPAVHALLAHLADRGFAGAPRAYGVDEQGREVLDFVEGEVLTYPLPPAAVSDEGLASVGRLLREYHDLTLDFVPKAAGAVWYLEPREPVEVLCHGDFAPHNVVFREGRAVAVIDFDTAHPGSRVWDFAWTACCFGLFPDSEGDAPDAAEAPDAADASDALAAPVRRVAVLADAYGLGVRERETLPEVMAERLRHLVAHIREQAAAGHPGFSRHVAEGHDVRYLAAAEGIEAGREMLLAAVAGG